MPKYKLLIEYDGKDFIGWQRQDNGASIQSSIEKAVKKFSKEAITVFGAGRTDSGVHARGQVAHFELINNFSLDSIRDGINQHLRPLPIAILSAECVDNDFHARFSAKQRVYEYHIISRRSPLTFQKNQAWIVHKKLNINKMIEAASYFEGKHDFNGFRSIDCQSVSSTKTIDKCKVKYENEFIQVEIAAQSFLHSQVRIIVGTLVEVGKEKINSLDIKNIIKSRDRTKAGITAPAEGLYLKEVKY